MPASTRGRRAWHQAAAEIEHHRRSHQISDPDRALGPEPHEPTQRADRRVRTAIERVHAKQRPPSAPLTPSPPASGPASRDLTSSVAGQTLERAAG